MGGGGCAAFDLRQMQPGGIAVAADELNASPENTRRLPTARPHSPRFSIWRPR